MNVSSKEHLEYEINELERKAKEAEEQFFISLDLSKFPLVDDIIFNKEKVIELITRIVWYILKKYKELLTLTTNEHNLIETLNNNENINYNKINKELQESFKKNKGKSIKEYIYDKEFYNLEKHDENYSNEQDYYINNNKDFIPDPRVDDIIDELQLLLFGKNGKKAFFEVFYEEYGEIRDACEEFISFCKKIIRENIFVSRNLQNQNNSNKRIISFDVKEVFKEASNKMVVRCVIKKGKKDLEKEIETENVIVKEKIVRIKRTNKIIFENINSVTIVKLNDKEYGIEIERIPEIQETDIIEIVEDSNMMSYTGRKKYRQYDEENINDENNEKEDNNIEEYKQTNDMNNGLIKFLSENSEEVNNTILKELLQNNSINKTEEIKKALIVFYIFYKNLIVSQSSKSPSDMTKVFTLLEKYFGEKETKQMKKEIQNFSQKEKQEWIKKLLDPLSFWETFSNKYKEDINNINYEKEQKKIDQKESTIKTDIILKMRDIIVNYLISKDISIRKTEVEYIIYLLKRLLHLHGRILTKLEINELANKISKYNPCDRYKNYIQYSVFGFIEKQKEIEEHIKKCKNCKSYKEYISSSKTLRENRNKKILKIVKINPYVAEQLNEGNYKDINYLKKQFRENPCETNFYYLVSAYIKNGNKKHAEKLLNEGFNLYKENVFMKETLIYLQEEN